MMKPLPTLSTAYALLIQEEHQREINVSPAFNSDAIAMDVFTNSNSQSS